MPSAETLAVLDRLIAFDTTSRNANVPLLEWVASYLADRQVEAQLLPAQDDGKANLVARIGPPEPGGVVLCGHTDVVPVDGQPWTRRPFALAVEDGRAYGRGTTDMKGFLASALAAVEHFRSQPLRRPITFALSHDEEVGCFGAPALAAHLVAHEPPPGVVVIGEPTQLRVVRTHKGVRALRTTIVGREAHSSTPGEGASAVVAGALLVAFVDGLAGRLAADGLADHRFVPPHTTMNIGTATGGTALNIVPRTCTLVWEYRCVPGEDADAIQAAVEAYARDVLLPRLWATAPEATITTEVFADVPPLDAARNAAPASLAAAWAGTPEGTSVAYGTDGGVLQAAGLPTVVCGPGSMDQGHRADEYIELAELDRCDAMMARIADWAAGA